MNSFLDTLRQFGAMRLAVMAAIVLGLLLFFVFIILRISQPPMKMLYTDLTPNDSSAIAGALEEASIPYEISSDGAKVSVAGNAVGRARMLLAEKGIPDGGSLGYELFDERSGFGTTEFVQNINQIRALEGELSRSINSMKAVRTSRVHLVLPKKELFSRETRKAKASVILDLRPSSRIDDQGVLAIQSLVAAAVPELKAEHVTVVLSDNTLLASGESDEKGVSGSKAAGTLNEYEKTIESKIEDQIGRVVGFDKVRATVTAEMNFDRVSTKQDLYDPSGQVVRSTQTTEETGKETIAPKVEVSVKNNLPGLGSDGADGGSSPGSENSKLEEVTNFEISHTTRSIISEGGQLKRLSVSVLVDGKYKKAPANEDGSEGELIYEPRTEKELDNIASLVKSAVGIDEGRGDVLEVINMRFATLPISEIPEEETGFLGIGMDELVSASETIILSIVAILVVLLIIQPMISKLVSSERSPDDEDVFDTEMLSAQAMPVLPLPEEEFIPPEEEPEEESLINIAGVEGKVKASTLKKVEEIVQHYPSEAVSVLRSWMTQNPSKKGE